jgi:hypothetical protein
LAVVELVQHMQPTTPTAVKVPQALLVHTLVLAAVAVPAQALVLVLYIAAL